MTKEQTVIYDYCKDHLKCIENWSKKLPFSIQKYGCGTGQPAIEYSLEKIHNDMYGKFLKAMNEASESIQLIIDKS